MADGAALRSAEGVRRHAEEVGGSHEGETDRAEEWIAGPSPFCSLGRRRTGREPSEAEIAARRRTVLAEPVAPDGVS